MLTVSLVVFGHFFPPQVLPDNEVTKETREAKDSQQCVSLHGTDLRAAETTQVENEIFQKY